MKEVDKVARSPWMRLRPLAERTRQFLAPVGDSSERPVPRRTEQR
jgi:hypothetical protein